MTTKTTACILKYDPKTCGVNIGPQALGCTKCPAYNPPMVINKIATPKLEAGDGMGYYASQPNTATPTVTECDARVRGGIMTLCEFAGHSHDPDKRRRCKFWDESSHNKGACMYYRKDFNGACDCSLR
jgi:hypothetical protein